MPSRWAHATPATLLHAQLTTPAAAGHVQAADTSSNGTLSGTEVQALLEGMGQRISTGKLAAVMDKYDMDKCAPGRIPLLPSGVLLADQANSSCRSGQLDFAEFLELFAEYLLDLQELQRFLHMDASPVGELRPGQGKLIQVPCPKMLPVLCDAHVCVGPGECTVTALLNMLCTSSLAGSQCSANVPKPLGSIMGQQHGRFQGMRGHRAHVQQPGVCKAAALRPAC